MQYEPFGNLGKHTDSRTICHHCPHEKAHMSSQLVPTDSHKVKHISSHEKGGPQKGNSTV